MTGGSRRAPVTLFPFLSVLICTIGALTLVLIGAVLVAPTVDAGTRDPKPKGFAPSEEMVASLRRRIRPVEAAIRRLRTEIALQMSQRRPELKPEEFVTEDEIAKLKDEVSNLEQLASALHRERDSLSLALKEGEAEPEPAVDTLLLPVTTFGKHDLKAVFVDCRSDGLMIVPTRTVIPLSQISLSTRLSKLIRKIKENRTIWCLQIMIREDGGVPCFNNLFNLVLDADIPFNFQAIEKEYGGDFLMLPEGVTVPEWLP